MSAQDRGIRRVIVGGLLTAVTLLLSLTWVGFIPTPTPAGSATLGHIPAIIGGILEGPLVGLIVSFGFGIGSFLSPLVPIKDPLVIILPRLLIGVVAAWVYVALRRSKGLTLVVLLSVMGLFAAATLLLAYRVSLKVAWLGAMLALLTVCGSAIAALWLRRQDQAVVSVAAAAVAGSLTNTVLVLSAAVLRDIPGVSAYMPLWVGSEYQIPVAVWIGLVQGIPEAVASASIVVIVVAALGKVYTGRERSRLTSREG
jgi:uncharacterized membrane protein